MAVRKGINVSVGLPYRIASSTLGTKIWYSPSETFDEIRDVKDRIRIVFFATQREIEVTKKETQVVGYFYYPEHKGKAVRDDIAGGFVRSDIGAYDVMSGEEGDVVRFDRYVRLPYLRTKRGRTIWQFDDSDTAEILRVALETHMDSEDSQGVQGIVSSIQAVLSELEEMEPPVSPEISREYESLSPWLRERLDQCQVAGFAARKEVVRQLIARAQERRNPEYYLQAAKLQIQEGDYKFVITLANYCTSLGYQQLSDKDWEAAFGSFLQAAHLYQLDPMITESGWKHDQRLRSLKLAIQAATCSVLDSHEYLLPAGICVDAVKGRVLEGGLKKQLPTHLIAQYVRDSYYVEMAVHLLNADQLVEFVHFHEEAPDEVEYPQWLTLRYYREKSRELGRGHDRSATVFGEAARFRKMAADLLAETEGKESTASLEELVDYHKLSALGGRLNGDLAGFEAHIDDAIALARSLTDRPEATEHHRENVDFLVGVKYGELARHQSRPRWSAGMHFRASRAYGRVNSQVAARRAAFHKLMAYQSLMLSKLGKDPEDFHKASLICRRAIAELWEAGMVELLDRINPLNYRAVFEAVCLMAADRLSPDQWHRVHRIHERIQTERVQDSARSAWNLVYATRLIEGSGVTLTDVVSRLHAAVRSAVCQLIERETVSEVELYDDLIAVEVRGPQDERRKRMLSLLRQGRLAEDLEVEFKEFLYAPGRKDRQIIEGLHEAAISFLNSATGGHVIIGVQDVTLSVTGVHEALERFGHTEAELKDSILDHIRNKIQEGLPLPTITVTFEDVSDGRRIVFVDVPPGDYSGSLYRNTNGVAFVRMDGSTRAVRNALEQDELAQQKRERKGPWAPID